MKRAALLLLAVLALAGCGGDEETASDTTRVTAPDTTAETAPETAPETTVTPAANVATLDNVLALRSDFEAGAGKTRVIVLLSPT